MPFRISHSIRNVVTPWHRARHDGFPSRPDEFADQRRRRREPMMSSIPSSFGSAMLNPFVKRYWFDGPKSRLVQPAAVPW
jgi:hypothetical protein